MSKYMIKPKLLQILRRAWNLEAFTSYNNYVTKVLLLDIGGIRAVNYKKRQLLRAEWNEPVLDIDLLEYPETGLASDRAFSLPLVKRRFTLGRGVEPVDFYWSREGELYVLDVQGGRIFLLDLDRRPEPPIADQSGAEGSKPKMWLEEVTRSIRSISNLSESQAQKIIAPTKTIVLSLPPKVKLDQSSRLAFIPHLTERPEDLNSAAFISAPSSNSILYVDILEGAVSVYAGRLNRKGKPKFGQLARETLLGSPGALAYDSTQGSLFVADKEEKAIYGIKKGGTIHLIVERTGSIADLRLYEPYRFVDELFLRERGDLEYDKTWGNFSSFLLAADVEGHDINMVNLSDYAKTSSRVADRHFLNANRLLILHNGDLLVGTEELSYYLHADISHSSNVVTALQS